MTDQEISVAQIRRSLSSLRSQWSVHSPANPICLSNVLNDGIIISEFCFNFVINHHSKRAPQKKNLLFEENH